MLINTFDQLTSGRRVRSIRFKGDDGHAEFGGDGIKIAVVGDDSDAEAWICADETGIWLSYNAHRHDRDGYYGNQISEDSLSSIQEIIFA